MGAIIYHTIKRLLIVKGNNESFNLDTTIMINKYLDEVDKLDEVDIDDDVDKELEVETLKGKISDY